MGGLENPLETMTHLFEILVGIYEKCFHSSRFPVETVLYIFMLWLFFYRFTGFLLKRTIKS